MDDRQAGSNDDSTETKIAEGSATANGGNPQKSDDVVDMPVSLPWWRRAVCTVWRWITQDTTSTDWAIVLLTAVIAATSILQWKVIKSGSTDTHTLAEAAKTQAEKTSGMADAADRIRRAADDMVAEERRLATNSQNAVEASNRQGKATLDATIAASRVDERAWVGVGVIRVVQLEKDKSLKVDVELRNTGKTPALNVQMGAAWRVDTIRTGPIADWFNYVLEPAEAVPPQGDHTMHLEIPSNVITPLWDEISYRTQYVYIVGSVKYTTISNQAGETNYCMFLDGQSREMRFCGLHNDMK